MQGLVGFVIMIYGIFGAAYPYGVWYLSVGWKFKDAEPSDAALVMHRIGGVVAVIIGFVVLVSSCSAGGGGGSYAKSFQERLIAGEVREINVGIGLNEEPLSQEELNRAVDLMAHAKMDAFELGTSYGWSGEATIRYFDGSTDDLILFGPSGGIELHPPSGNRAYQFRSDEIESLFRSALDREKTP